MYVFCVGVELPRIVVSLKSLLVAQLKIPIKSSPDAMESSSSSSPSICRIVEVLLRVLADNNLTLALASNTVWKVSPASIRTASVISRDTTCVRFSGRHTSPFAGNYGCGSGRYLLN
jgi:hypothetical protein